MTEKDGDLFRKFPAADGVRGVAVLIVIIAHALVMFIPATRPYLGGTGKMGVWLFFVLSAFLLTNKFIRIGLNRNSLLEYFFGRTARILPLFTISVIFYYLAGYYNLNTLISVVTFQEGFAHLWTIPVEFKFYFILPMLVFVMNAAMRRFGVGAVLLITMIFIIISRHFYPESGSTGNTIETRWYISSFLVGIFTSYFVASFKVKQRNLGLAMFFCIIGILALVPSMSKIMIGYVLLPGLDTSYLSLSMLWSIFILISINDSGLSSRILTSRVMRNIGAQSFSTYLFHWFVLSEVSKRYSGNLPLMILSIIASLIIGAIIFNLIERNIENLRHKVQTKIISTEN